MTSVFAMMMEFKFNKPVGLAFDSRIQSGRTQKAPATLPQSRQSTFLDASLPGILIVWLPEFDYLEEYTILRYFPNGDAPIMLDLIDLVMWLGWIPFVVMLHTELTGSAKKSAVATTAS